MYGSKYTDLRSVINNELSNRISYYICTFDDVLYVVCCVGVATSPVQVTLGENRVTYVPYKKKILTMSTL